MKNHCVSSLKIILSSLLILAVNGCGSASNNDQGVSFTLLGFFADFDGEVGLAGAAVPIGEILPATTEPGGSLPAENDPPVGTVPGATDFVAVVGSQNNLSSQTIRVERAFLTYVIPGSSAQPPSTSVPLTVVLGPNPGTSQRNPADFFPGSRAIPTSDLPPGISGEDSQGTPVRAYSQIPLITSSVRTWMNLNRDLLPEPPFQLELSVVLSGVTSAGDRLESNQGTLWISITPETSVPPTVGENTGSGTVEAGTGDAEVSDPAATDVSDLETVIPEPTAATTSGGSL